jgi:hypothetical protein
MRKFGLALAFAVGLIMSVSGAAKAAVITQNLGTLNSANTSVDFTSEKLDGSGKGQFLYNFTIGGGAAEADGSVTSSSTLGVKSLKTFTFGLYSGVFGSGTLIKQVSEADAFYSPSGGTSVDLDFAHFLAAGSYYLFLDVTSGRKFANVSGNLTIAPVPVPAALPMFGAVLVGLVAFQSRRRNRLNA